MKLSLLYELQTPRPWDEDSEHRKVQEALEQIEVADQLGFHGVWAVEHHFLEEMAHSSAPEVFLAAASQRSKNLRIGHGIVQAPPPINHPLRVAERVAMLDLVSGGRVEFGSGEGASLGELEGFGVDPQRKRDMWREGLQIILAAMTEEPFAGWDGEFINLPPRNVVPKPKQRPHPPLWLATSKLDTVELAARNGMGALVFGPRELGICREWVDFYFRTMADEGVPIGSDVNPKFSMTTFAMWGPTREEARDRVKEALVFTGMAGNHYYRDGRHEPAVTSIWEQYLAFNEVHPDAAPRAPFTVGTAEEIAADLRPFEDAGVEEIMLLLQLGNNKHEHILETIEVLGREVIPELNQRHQAGQAEREQRNAAIRERTMARKPVVERRPPEGYAFGTVESGMATMFGVMADEMAKADERRAAELGLPPHVSS